MIEEDKQLLLMDLCARLPYGVKCYHVITNGEPNTIGGYCETLNDFYIREVSGWFNISMIKPFLRPMSSMTEKEKEEVKPLFSKFTDEFGKRVLVVRQNKMVLYQDWLNKNMFDYRGLIPMGLAIKAPKGMYNLNK